MCVLFVAWQQNAAFPLIVAANRDEYYARQARPARFWHGPLQILAGRDEHAGGTWLGVNKNGYFAALTNYREIKDIPADARSRGLLVADFLNGRSDAPEYADRAATIGSRYAGFSLLLYDGQQLVYCSNRSTEPHTLAPGQYGLSNHLLDTDWPKINHGKAQFDTALRNGAQVENLFALLRDRSPVPDDELPDTGVGREWERLLSPIFVTTGEYGTRCATCVRIGTDGMVEFEERSFDPGPVQPVDPTIYRSVRYCFPTTG